MVIKYDKHKSEKKDGKNNKAKNEREILKNIKKKIKINLLQSN